MSPPPYMKLYVGDYLGDTHHLGALEHGAYLLLLMAMWRAGGALPRDDEALARLARCTDEQWAQIAPVVLGFFRRTRWTLKHKRLAEEMARYEAVSRHRTEAGKRGGRKTLSKARGLAEANARQLPPYPEPEPEPSESRPAAAGGGPPRADDWPQGDLKALRAELVSIAGPGLADPAREPGLLTTMAEIGRWRRMGCSWAQDVAPVIAGRTQKPRASRLRTWSVFTPDVLAAKARREREAEPAGPAPAGPFQTASQRAEAERREGRRRLLEQIGGESLEGEP